MRLAIIEFTQQETELTLADFGLDGPKPKQTYVEARLLDPPIDFAIGYGRTVSEAFANLQSRVLDTAIYSARLLHDDPEEWKRRSEAEQKSGEQEDE